jgi:hypothetical protein
MNEPCVVNRQLIKLRHEPEAPVTVRLLLEKAGFAIEAEKGDRTDAKVTADHTNIVFVARRK